MIEFEQASLFDYASLDSDTRAFVQEKAQAIHARLKRTAEDIIAIGQDLIEVKGKLPDMKFSAWLRTEFDMSRPTAYRFMAVATRFGDSCLTVRQLSTKVLYELASPSTPDTIIEMVEAGQIPATITAIREARQAEKYVDPVSLPVLEPELGPIYGPVYVPSNGKFAEMPEEMKLPSSIRETHPILNTLTSKSNEWYTPAKYVEAARELMGGIDVDPASNSTANETINATIFYDIQTNGLNKDWTGRVWLNPPYGRDEAGSNQDIWSKRLIEQHEAGITIEAVLLVNAAVDTKWFQRLFQYPVCFPDHRINFYSPDSPVSGSTHGSALIYFGHQKDRFFEIFSEFGTVVRLW